MPTLYRKYRPHDFSGISGQDHITKPLQKAIITGRLAHALLFHGPRGTGKTTMARIVAKRLSCTVTTTGEACGRCQLCLATETNKNIDIIEIDAASNRGIDDIRALKEGVNSSPAMGPYKIYIIDEVHMLTKEAFTALLKTLEEPVRHAIFILATTEFHKVPETIISRCQVYRFRRASDAQLLQRLKQILSAEKRSVGDDALGFIISRSDGCYRDAESLLGQVLSLETDDVGLEHVTNFLGLPPQKHLDQFLAALISRDAGAAIDVIDTALAAGYDPDQFVQESIRLAREGAISLIKVEGPAYHFTSLPEADARLPIIMRALVQALQDLTYVPQPALAIHLAILTLCQPISGSTITSKPTQHKSVARPTAALKITPALSKPANKPITINSSALLVSNIKKIWPQLIDQIKIKNPIAATFLRAMIVKEATKEIVRIEAQYELHRNYFEKSENKLMLQQALGDLLKQKITIRISLPEQIMNTSVQDRMIMQENNLLNAVQEVFGNPAAGR